MYLYIDTTYCIRLGLLSKNLSWLDYEKVDSKKSSEKLHCSVDLMLKRQNLTIGQLDKVIYCAGPGSYTGMRVAEGFVNVLDWQGVDYYSFYHFQIPFLKGRSKGLWYAKAFKGEIFIYHWDAEVSDSVLIKEGELSSFLEKRNVSNKDLETIETTAKLIKDNPRDIFQKIIDSQSREELFYYRSIEKEFVRSK